MSSNRKIVFANGEYYHVFNRGVEKRPVFTQKYEFSRAVETANFYRFGELPIRYSKYLNLSKEKKIGFMDGFDEKKLQVEIVAFCLMGNHFHFLLKQLKDNGIVQFMANFQNSYTKYFNTKHQRVGPLFQGVFKAVYVENNEQLLHLSRYIHLNPVVGFVIKAEDLSSYRWSSYPSYMRAVDLQITNNEIIMNQFKDKKEYEKFVLDQADYAIQLKNIEHLMIDT